MKIALIGLGSAARRIHVPAIRLVPRLHLVGGCDVSTERPGFNFPLFTDVEQMIDTCKPDIVAIVTPTDSHFDLACRVVAKGVHVFCEKPFTATVAQASELLARARARGVQVAVNNEFRFMACHLAAKACIGTAPFGELLFVNVQQSFRTSAETEAGWRGDDLERTNKDFGTHVFDLCRFFFGEEPRRMRSVMPRPGLVGGPDLLNLIDLEFSRDRFARITLDRVTRGRHRYLDMRLDGTGATVETELGGHAALSVGVHAAERRPFVDFDVSFGGRAFLCEGERRRKLAADPMALFAAATARLLERYVDALQTGGEVPCSGADNIRTLALMRAAYEAAGSRQEIDLGFLHDLS